VAAFSGKRPRNRSEDAVERTGCQIRGMANRIHLVPHLTTEELGRRYKAMTDGIERSHLQIIWLLSQGHAAKHVAEITGYSPNWVSEILWRYNDHGVEGLGDGRHDNPGAAPLLTDGDVDQLRDTVSEPPPDGGLWTGRKVARWMAGKLGRLVSAQRGVEYLRRLDMTPQVPRPCNPKQNLYEQEAFKKNSRPGSRNSLARRRRYRLKSGPSMSTGSD
jgi:transposase